MSPGVIGIPVHPLAARTHGSRGVSVIILAAVVVLVIVRVVIARRRGYAGDATQRIVRCSTGHVFTTVWLPGVSFKSIRLGGARLQRCPVGSDWSLVRLVPEDELTDEDRRNAEKHRDTAMPAAHGAGHPLPERPLINPTTIWPAQPAVP